MLSQIGKLDIQFSFLLLVDVATGVYGPYRAIIVTAVRLTPRILYYSYIRQQ